MPTTFTKTAGGTDYGNPFSGPINHTTAIPVDMDGMTVKEVDADGVLKPGIPLLRSGALVSAPGQVAFGVTVEAVKVATGNGAAALTAAGSPEIAVALIGALKLDIGEDILDRAYTADEKAALAAAGSLIKLID